MFERELKHFIEYLVVERGLSVNTKNAYSGDLEEFAGYLS